MLSEKINPAASGFGKGSTHIGQIILSTTLDTVDKVIELYDGEWEPFGAGQVLVGAGTIPSTKEGEEDRVFTAGSTGSAGGGQPHNNMQPYVVVYMWHRVA